MKRAYAASQYAKLYEQYCKEHYPDKANELFAKAEKYYRKFSKDMPDLGENMMAKNMLDWFTILSFYEASEHRLDGEVLVELKPLHFILWDVPLRNMRRSMAMRNCCRICVEPIIFWRKSCMRS